MRRAKVLYLRFKDRVAWCDEDLIRTVGQRHDLRIFDHSRPVSPQLAEVEAVIDLGGDIGTTEMVDAARSAKLWQILGMGINRPEMVRYISQKDIAVANCPGHLSSEALAECAMMLMLMLAREYKACEEQVKNRKLYLPMGRGLKNRVLALIGLGASGQELARRAKACGMRIMAIDVRQFDAPFLEDLGVEFLGGPADMDKVIGQCDFLSLHLNLNDQTRHIIDARRIALMKPEAYLINVARGALIDEAALNEALLERRIGGAGLDCLINEPADPSQPVYQLPNVLITPHIAGTTDGTSQRRALAAAENVDRLVSGLEPLYLVKL